MFELGLARFKSLGTLRFGLVQIYKGNGTLPLDHNVKDDP